MLKLFRMLRQSTLNDRQRKLRVLASHFSAFSDSTHLNPDQRKFSKECVSHIWGEILEIQKKLTQAAYLEAISELQRLKPNQGGGESNV